MNNIETAYLKITNQCKQIIESTSSKITQYELDLSLKKLKDFEDSVKSPTFNSFENLSNQSLFYFKMFQIVGRIENYWNKVEKFTIENHLSQLSRFKNEIDQLSSSLDKYLSELNPELRPILESYDEIIHLYEVLETTSQSLTKAPDYQNQVMADWTTLADLEKMDDSAMAGIQNLEIKVHGHGVFDSLYPGLLKENRQIKTQKAFLLYTLREIILLFHEYDLLSEDNYELIINLFGLIFDDFPKSYDKDYIKKQIKLLQTKDLISI